MTTTKSRWADLIERLEAAEGPSRELSDAVLLACGWRSTEAEGEKDARLFCWSDPAGDIYDWWDDPHARSSGPMQHRPHPTESVDAALSWVPEGWGWSVGDVHPPSEDYDEGGRPWAEIWQRGFQTRRLHLEGMNWTQGRWLCNAETPSLALCIANARAMEAMES